MEVEVWSCPTRRRHSEGSDRGPGSDDTLLGTVSISLQALSSKDTIRQASIKMFVLETSSLASDPGLSTFKARPGT